MKLKNYFFTIFTLGILGVCNAQLTSSIKVDIDGAAGPTQTSFTSMATATGSSITEQGVTITASGQTGSRNRTDNPQGAPTLDFADMQRDLVFAAGAITITLDGLPADDYNLYVVAYDHPFPSPVELVLQEQGSGSPIQTVRLNEMTDSNNVVDDTPFENGQPGNTPSQTNHSPSPAVFNFTASAATTYEVIITGITSSAALSSGNVATRGSRFNGLEIAPVGVSAVLTTNDFSKSIADIQVSPNPFSTELNIKSSVSLTKAKLYNITGSLVKESSLYQLNGAYTMKTSDLPSGVYFVALYDGQAFVATQKLIKE